MPTKKVYKTKSRKGVPLSPGWSPDSVSNREWPSLTKDQITQFEKLFADADDDGNGTLDGEEAAAFMIKLAEGGRVRNSTLELIWDLCDEDDSGYLECGEFIKAMYLVECARNGHGIPRSEAGFPPGQFPPGEPILSYPPPKKKSGGLLGGLKSQVSKSYFPFILFILAACNTFVVFLSGAVTTLFLTSCATVGKNRWTLLVSLFNAAGATAGFAGFIFLLEQHGTDWFRKEYPEVFASPYWSQGEQVINDYGWPGVAGLSAMPFPLHPLVLAGVLAGMEKQMLLSALFAGRSVKYLVFGVIASASPGTFKSLIAVIFMIEKPKEKAN
ncbi:hypothetical protein OAD67_01720 [bacterium]|jgi:hypothetical protein|nr:hypothetical protein [bacterium]|tara:strand:+ start:27478 stop:28461 length:984 start_codon:yes stop_codon:yes gene_type:complete